MTKFEYLVAKTAGDVVFLPTGQFMPVPEFLNFRGDEGWELVAIAVLVQTPALFFKRPKKK